VVCEVERQECVSGENAAKRHFWGVSIWSTHGYHRTFRYGWETRFSASASVCSLSPNGESIRLHRLWQDDAVERSRWSSPTQTESRVSDSQRATVSKGKHLLFNPIVIVVIVDGLNSNHYL